VLDTPQVMETADQLTAFIPLVVPRAEIQAVMGPSNPRGISPPSRRKGSPRPGRGSPTTGGGPSDTFDFDVCVPVAHAVAATGRVKPGRLPSTKVARRSYSGPYEASLLPGASSCAWIEANGHTPPRADLWECYVAGPESNPDPGHLAHGTQPPVGWLANRADEGGGEPPGGLPVLGPVNPNSPLKPGQAPATPAPPVRSLGLGPQQASAVACIPVDSGQSSATIPDAGDRGLVLIRPRGR